MSLRTLIALLVTIGLTSGCSEPTQGHRHDNTSARTATRDLSRFRASIKHAVDSAVQAFPSVARDEASYDYFSHLVPLRSLPVRLEEESSVEVGETEDGKPIWRVESKRPPVKGTVLGITNRAGHPAPMVATLLRLGADHDLLDVTELLEQARQHPMEEAFLLLALEEYKDAGVSLLHEARRVLDGLADNSYLLIAAIRIAARYGYQTEVERVRRYLGHAHIDVRSAARWAWTILEEECVESGARRHEKSRYPPEQVQDPLVRDAILQQRSEDAAGRK